MTQKEVLGIVVGAIAGTSLCCAIVYLIWLSYYFVYVNAHIIAFIMAGGWITRNFYAFLKRRKIDLIINNHEDKLKKSHNTVEFKPVSIVLDFNKYHYRRD